MNLLTEKSIILNNRLSVYKQFRIHLILLNEQAQEEVLPEAVFLIIRMSSVNRGMRLHFEFSVSIMLITVYFVSVISNGISEKISLSVICNSNCPEKTLEAIMYQISESGAIHKFPLVIQKASVSFASQKEKAKNRIT